MNPLSRQGNAAGPGKVPSRQTPCRPGALTRRESSTAAWGHAAYRMELNPAVCPLLSVAEIQPFPCGKRLPSANQNHTCCRSLFAGSPMTRSTSAGSIPNRRCLAFNSRSNVGPRYSAGADHLANQSVSPTRNSTTTLTSSRLTPLRISFPAFRCRGVIIRPPLFRPDNEARQPTS